MGNLHYYEQHGTTAGNFAGVGRGWVYVLEKFIYRGIMNGSILTLPTGRRKQDNGTD
jgi:hypothetical protein